MNGSVSAPAKFREAGMFMDAGRRVGPSAGAQGDFSVFEMAEELLPFLLCRGAVFLAGPQRPSAGDERPVAVDGLLGIDR